MPKALVYVTFKTGVLDPQGKPFEEHSPLSDSRA